MEKGLYFKVDTPALLKEIADCGLPHTAGVLKVPLNVFKGFLAQISDRAIILSDPILNEIMCDMRLYELPNPDTKEYKNIMVGVRKSADIQRKKESGK